LGVQQSLCNYVITSVFTSKNVNEPAKVALVGNGMVYLL
jgi:hypothetical protein